MQATTSSTSTIMCADAVLADHAYWVAAVARSHDAWVIDSPDDTMTVAFDSASAAVRAAVEVQQEVARAVPGQPIRIGLATGDVTWSDSGCSGAPVQVAAELLLRAQPGEILVSNVVRWSAVSGPNSFVSIGPVEIDGADGPVEAFAVDWQPMAAGAAEESTEPLSVPLPAALATTSRQRLVGREAEWDVLAGAWARTEAGSREVVLIGGEPGAGKTRLAAEFARRCHDSGAIVLFGTCDEELALPFQPWVHALDHLLRSFPGFGRPTISDRDLGDLLVLLPQLERLLPGLPRPAVADPETERYLLFSAVDRVLAASARQVPLLLLLDDVHWAGRQTLELLRHLVRAGSASGLMIVATFRDSAAELSDPLAEALVDLQRSESVTRIRLGGLDAASVEQFVSAALDQELDRGPARARRSGRGAQRRQCVLSG